MVLLSSTWIWTMRFLLFSWLVCGCVPSPSPHSSPDVLSHVTPTQHLTSQHLNLSQFLAWSLDPVMYHQCCLIVDYELWISLDTIKSPPHYSTSHPIRDWVWVKYCYWEPVNQTIQYYSLNHPELLSQITGYLIWDYSDFHIWKIWRI